MQIIHARAYTHEAQIGTIPLLCTFKHCLKLVTCLHALLHSVLPMAELLVPLAAKMSEEPFRLIIMDSITANLRVDFTGRGIPNSSIPPCCIPAEFARMARMLSTCCASRRRTCRAPAKARVYYEQAEEGISW